MIIATILIISGAICVPEIMVYADKSNLNSDIVSRIIMDAFNDEDVQNMFTNYTDNTYSYTSNKELFREDNEELDYYTGTTVISANPNPVANPN